MEMLQLHQCYIGLLLTTEKFMIVISNIECHYQNSIFRIRKSITIEKKIFFSQNNFFSFSTIFKTTVNFETFIEAKY